MFTDKWSMLRDYLINELVNEVHNGAVENMINEVLSKMDVLENEEFNNRQALTSICLKCGVDSGKCICE
jgi:BMFP domain-containing protein YqiC